MKGPPARHEEPKEQYPAVEGIISDAKELRPGDRVVYPNQGVCRIVGVEQQDIAGQRLDLVRMAREEDGATVMVPKGKVPAIGLRKVASAEQIEGVVHYLAASYDDPELDWKVRHRDNADRLIAGGVLGVAEVVKGLHSLSRIRPLPTKEREQYDNARHLLVHEVAVSLGVPPALAEDYIDYALMPPADVKFKLKPPPPPVVLPSRTRRRPAPVPEEEEDLGLADLGLDLGALGEQAEATPAEGGTAEGGTAEEEEEHEGGGEAAGTERHAAAVLVEEEEEEEQKRPAEAAKAGTDEEEAAPPRRPSPRKSAKVKKPAHAKLARPAARKAVAKKPAPKKVPARKPAPKRGKPAKKAGGRKR